MGTFCCICIAEVSRHMGPYMINLLLKLHIDIVDISETVLQLPLNSKLISLQNIYLPRVYNCHYRQFPDAFGQSLKITYQ